MSLNIKALTITSAVFVGGSFLVVGLVNLMSPGYGVEFLELGKALYPGYAGPAGLGSVIVVTLYGTLDGAVGGAIFGWLYNRLTGRAAAVPTPS